MCHLLLSLAQWTSESKSAVNYDLPEHQKGPLEHIEAIEESHAFQLTKEYVQETYICIKVVNFEGCLHVSLVEIDVVYCICNLCHCNGISQRGKI